MHRFMTLKKLHIKNINTGSTGLRNSRTCTLCNRISSHLPFTDYVGSSRIHSTWLNPEHVTFVANKKKRRYKLGNVVLTHADGKSKRKTKITLLDSKETEEETSLDVQSFLTSSPSSPAFSMSKLGRVGITIMLPPNSTRNLNFQELTPAPNEELLTVPKRSPTLRPTSALSQEVLDLILKGIARNKLSMRDYPSPSAELNARRMMNPVEIPDITSVGSCLKTETSMALKDLKPNESVENASCLESTSLEEILSQMKNSKKEKLTVKKQMLLRGNITKQKRIFRRAAYIDVCLNSGKVKNALHYATRGLQFFPNVPCRNIILEPLFSHAAHEKNIVAVSHALILANKYNTPLTASSYVVVFEMLASMPATKGNLEIARSLVQNMMKENVTVDDLVACCKGREVLIQKVLRSIQSTGLLSTKYSKPGGSKYPVTKLSSSYQSPATGLLSVDSAEKLIDEQISIHSSFEYKVKNIACTLSESEINELISTQKEVEEGWRTSLIAGFQSSMHVLKTDKSSFQLTSFLESLPAETFADLIIQEIHNRIEDSDKQSVGFIFAQVALGRKVKEIYDMEVMKRYGVWNKAKQAHIDYCKQYFNPEGYPPGPSNPREVWDSVVKNMQYNDSCTNFLLREWYPELYLKIGKFLYDILLKDVKIDENIKVNGSKPHMVPALYVVFRKSTRGYQKQLKMHPSVHHVFPNKMQPFLKMNPYELPMLCPPRPWTSATNGVYSLSTPLFQRHPETRIGAEALEENYLSVPTEQLYPSLDSLNQLGSVPWKINNPVLDVICEVFHSGGSEILTIPAPPSAAIPEPSMPANTSLAERIKITKERNRIRQDNAAMYSQWCDTLYKLCIANDFRDRVFWLPHNMDFRGRVYPVCPHLQHMSNDLARSLLIFAKGEKLGPDGLNWLKLHTINLVGEMSRESLDARLAYANEVMPKILDSAERPLTGEKWWMNSECPWQTLAACKEIAAAISNGDPANFISHFPVHQDGSCNGLQHYAAMGRDTLGAQSVNLVDTVIPSDVYSCVAESVEKQRARDAANGDKMAQSLEGFIIRKVVKQTIMTSVYGVTNYGAQLQIEGQLKALKYPLDDVPPAALYITKLVFQSLGEMFTTSRKTMEWLTNCANGIVKSKNMPVKWVTPLGLPVIQPYFKKNFAKVDSLNLPEGEWINPSLYRIPVLKKQRNAFSPNFVHSLDSCHMILTGLHCEQVGITFVSVHDCYWVHAKNVTEMSKICREQFVALHSEPILEDLAKFLTETYSNKDHSTGVEGVEERRLERLFSSVPPKGNFDLNLVLNSKYFFS
ncbi:DNA-directed RNA polymerase, mitochondrial [Thrips palmi]|uniref:DNA-directed RNA polymerase n=1 Tax=Thrips palmi TaxID=161013 RepID=A0A6P8ZPC2_THRPL|nr:DNA-directed RNA polymerase, mitochondrial [Thrips palmi]